MIANPLTPTLKAMAELPHKSSVDDVVYGRVAAINCQRPGSRIGTEQGYGGRTDGARAPVIPLAHAVTRAVGLVAGRK